MTNRAQLRSLKNRYHYRWILLTAIVLGILALSLRMAIQPTLSDAMVPEPGEPPVASVLSPIVQSPRMVLADTIEIFLPVVIRPVSFTVNPQDRGESLSFYQSQYLMASNPPINWTGAHASCNPGTTGGDFRSAILRRINYFRAMAGVPDNIVFSPSSTEKAQAAALMMSVNRALSHTPPSSWLCYSDLGASGAGSANLYLGAYNWNAITGYIQDPGTGNYAVGHRRWILYPQTQEMGTGDIPPVSGYPSANALVVFDSHLWEQRPVTRDEFVAWPPPGYVPYPVVFGRWSFSYANANFNSATVSMTSGGINIPVSQSPVVNGYGENTLVWIPAGMTHQSLWPKPSSDTLYTVNIQNVMMDNVARSFTYDVIIFDPG